VKGQERRHGPAAGVGVVALEPEVQSVAGGLEGGDDVARGWRHRCPGSGSAGGPWEQVEGGGTWAWAGRVDEVVEGGVVVDAWCSRDGDVEG
jgi:hypothetical protein